MGEILGKFRRNSILRAVFVGISLCLQIGWILLMIVKLNAYSTYIALMTSLLASLVILRLYSRRRNNAYRMPWIMVMMALPVMGLSLYLITEVALSPRRIHSQVKTIRNKCKPYLMQGKAGQQLARQDKSAGNLSHYLWNYDRSPVYTGTDARYYGHGRDFLPDLLRDLENAEKFIFMEYFIVEDGESFSRIREVLARKAAEGLDVRLMYDDIGSIGYVDFRFARELNEQGIRCQVFNPALPFLKLFMNNRDHRKITVIDGKIGYTGGYNLADAYFGLEHPYGQWKDTGLRLEGEAVRSLTATFLELWTVTARKEEYYGKFLETTASVPGSGFVQPFADSPLDGEETAENVYINLLSQARDYAWFMTPYLIITDELAKALELAAKRGVDVRIMTPGIPDKRAVYAVTRSYYARLVEDGVRIFEYSPGFCHGKQCLVDDCIASIGTSNLDYRSLYLHFENNVVLYGCDCLQDMKQDFEKTFSECREVTDAYRSAPMRLWECILRLFAPML
jgi:cardiolipin synthase